MLSTIKTKKRDNSLITIPVLSHITNVCMFTSLGVLCHCYLCVIVRTYGCRLFLLWRSSLSTRGNTRDSAVGATIFGLKSAPARRAVAPRPTAFNIQAVKSNKNLALRFTKSLILFSTYVSLFKCLKHTYTRARSLTLSCVPPLIQNRKEIEYGKHARSK